jgi:hypothetical protein
MMGMETVTLALSRLSPLRRATVAHPTRIHIQHITTVEEDRSSVLRRQMRRRTLGRSIE